MSEPAIDALAQAALTRCWPALRGTRSRQAILEDLQAALAADAATRTGDPAWAERYAARCPAPGVSAGDYHLRRLSLEGERVWAGIHFFGLDPSRPFVGVVARTGSLGDRAAVERLVGQLSQEFAAFSPLDVRLYQPAPCAEVDLSKLPGARPDHRLIAGRVAAIRRLPLPPGAERVRLQARADAAGFFDRYQETYAAFHQARPALADRVTPESRETLDDCGRAGGLFEIWIDGEWAGVIAAEPTRNQGLAGASIAEEILTERFRGQRLAPAAQRRMIDALPESMGELIFGTIDATNAPSLRTALRVGRRDVGGWWFLPTGRGAP